MLKKIITLDNLEYFYKKLQNEREVFIGTYPLINHGTSDTDLFALTPNTFHVWGEVQRLLLVLGEEIADVANEYIFQFTSGDEATRFSVPDDIKFPSNFTVEANKIYQISILNGLGSVMSWDI